MSATIQLSTRAEIDGLESKRTTALKSDMKYVGKDGSLQVLVFTHNCTRVLMRILLESGLFEEKWWPQTHASPSMMRVSTRSKCDQFELSLNKLERLPREDITRMVKALLAIDTQKKWPYFTEVMQDFLAQRDEAFDQYSGVRQVGDLRGIPGRGAALFIAAKKEVDMLFNFAHCVFVFAFANVYNDVSFGGGSLGILNKIAPVSKAAFAQLPREYELMLSAIVDCLGCLRSKLAKSPNGDSYNDLYKKYFIDDVIRAASELEVTKKSEFDALIATVRRRDMIACFVAVLTVCGCHARARARIRRLISLARRSDASSLTRTAGDLRCWRVLQQVGA
jgi:hypothetical protein